MKKKDYRKIIKSERHICYRNAWHLGCATCYFVMLIAITTLLVFFNELPIKPFFVVYAMAAIFIAIPIIILDQLNDRQMYEGMDYYDKNHKTKPGVDYVGYIKTVEFISVALLIMSLATIYFRFLKHDYKQILLGDITTIRASKKNINKALDIYIPDKFEIVDDIIDNSPENSIYSITYNQKDTYISIYFTDIEISEDEIYNYVASMEYYYTESKREQVSSGDSNSISFIHNDKYYYISYYSYKGKVVQITYSCGKDDLVKWSQGFTTINENISFK